MNSCETICDEKLFLNEVVLGKIIETKFPGVIFGDKLSWPVPGPSI